MPKNIFTDFIYLFLERREGREKQRERNINVWLPLTCPLLGTWPITQACALTGNQTSDPFFLRLALNPLSPGQFLLLLLLLLSSIKDTTRRKTEDNHLYLPIYLLFPKLFILPCRSEFPSSVISLPPEELP